jgi:hypothetical protein
MLPPFIIEQIRKRESEENAQHEQPRLELPLPRAPRERGGERPRPDDAERGVIILELL